MLLPGIISADEIPLHTDQPISTRLAEAELIARILKGERKLFHELVRPYERAVFVTAYAVLRNHADAEEAAQESMLKAMTHLEQLKQPEKFKGWLLQIALNEARLKRRGKRDHLFESIEGDGSEQDEPFMPRDFADWREMPSEILERTEIRETIAKALLELTPIYREIFVLRDVQQLGVAECRQILGVSEQVVKVRLHRARLMMREKLAPAFKRRWVDRLALFKGKKPW